MNVFLAFDQGIPVAIQGKVTLVITEIIGMSVFGLVKVGEVIKLKSPFDQLFPGNFALPLGIGFQEDPAVFAQGIVDVAHDVVAVTVQAVIVCAPALVCTELFIRTAHDFIPAFNAFCVHVFKDTAFAEWRDRHAKPVDFFHRFSGYP